MWGLSDFCYCLGQMRQGIVSEWLGLALLLVVSASPAVQSVTVDNLRQAELYLADNNLSQALAAAQKALDLDPHSAEANAIAGAAEFGLGEMASAQKHLQAALQLDPGLLLARRTLGGLYLKQKRAQDASRQFEKALESHPQDFVSRYGLGLALLMDHQPAAARRQLEQALLQKPNDPRVLLGILQADLQLHRSSEAAASLAQLDSQLDPRNPVRREIAALLVSQGAYELAAQEFERLCEVDPDSYDLHFNLALAYYRAGKADRSSETLRNLLNHYDNAEVENLLGEVECSRGDNAKGISAYRRAAELDPRNEDYRYDYAQALAHEWQLNQALEVFRGAADDFPQSPRIWMGWGAAYYLAGRYSEAAQTLLHAAEIAPQAGEIYYLLGRVYDAAGTFQTAIAEKYNDYCRKEPGDPWGQYFYGHILASGQQASAAELRDAQDHLEKAIALNKNLAEAHAELGKVLDMGGNLEAARNELERAVQLDPHSSSTYYRLGIVYRKLGNTALADQAMAKFQQLKAQERESSDREHIQGFLERARQNKQEQ